MRQWTVDAFASAPFRGNPACVLEPFAAWPEDDWMQALAKENNQAETAFLLRTDDPARFGLRWFTPALEAPICGHATLASAHVLFSELGVEAETLTFDSRRGDVLTVRRAGEAYVMDFPADPPRRVETPPGLVKALGVEPTEVWVAGYMLAVLFDETTVRELAPDIAALGLIGEQAAEGRGNMIVCAPADAGKSYQVVSRFFAPGSGIAEDPATGSAHCILAPLFAERLGRTRLDFFQACPGRGAEITAEMRGDRALLGGRAVTVIESRLRL